MRFERQTQGLVVLHHMFGQRHDWQVRVWFASRVGGVGVDEQRQGFVPRQAADRPERLAAIKAK